MGRGPVPLRRTFARESMRPRGVIGHHPGFPRAVPVRGVGRPRVTRPFAALTAPGGADPARLACVRRAASVRPEPGSNSPSERRGTSRAAGPCGPSRRARWIAKKQPNLPIFPALLFSFPLLAVSGSQGSPRRLADVLAAARGSNLRTRAGGRKGETQVHDLHTSGGGAGPPPARGSAQKCARACRRSAASGCGNPPTCGFFP